MATVATKKTVGFVSNCAALAAKIMMLPAQQVRLDYETYLRYRKMMTVNNELINSPQIHILRA